MMLKQAHLWASMFHCINAYICALHVPFFPEQPAKRRLFGNSQNSLNSNRNRQIPKKPLDKSTKMQYNKSNENTTKMRLCFC